MADKLRLYNLALLHMGKDRLQRLQESSEPRRALDDAWDMTAAYCLEQGFWNFAMRAVMLSSTPSIEPAFGYSFAVEKPADWVRTLNLSANEVFDPPLLDFRDEGGYWFFDCDPVYARYVSNDTSYGLNLGNWPESFGQYVAWRLAVLCWRRICEEDPPDRVLRAERRALADSRSKDAMNEPPGFAPTGSWVNSRRAGPWRHGFDSSGR